LTFHSFPFAPISLYANLSELPASLLSANKIITTRKLTEREVSMPVSGDAHASPSPSPNVCESHTTFECSREAEPLANHGEKRVKESGGSLCSSLSYDEREDESSATVILTHALGSPGNDSIGTVSPSRLINSDKADIAEEPENNKLTESIERKDAPKPDEDSSDSTSFGPEEAALEESVHQAQISTLQQRLRISQAALQSKEEQIKEAQNQIFVLQKKCADLEWAQSNSQDANPNQRDALERLRAKNTALIEQCSLLQTMSDKDAATIRELRTAYANMTQQKTEMEVEFCNQLSTLSAAIKSTEDDNMEQLKAKQSTIFSLKKHSQQQENQIIQLQEEVYEMKEELLNKAKTENSSSTGTLSHQPSKVLILEQEKKLLLERVEFLTLNRTSMTEEVDELRDQVGRLSDLECKVVPQLKEELEATRDTLKALEREMQMILKNHANSIEELQKSIVAADIEKRQLEEDFLQQIISLAKQKKSIVNDYQAENAEKGVFIKKIENQISSLKEKILQMQSKSELEEISGKEETERLFQMHMLTEEKLSEQDAIIQELKFSIREEQKLNASLAKELKKLRLIEHS